MKTERMSEAEWKLMRVIWENEPVTAKEVAESMESSTGWKTNTTYTVLSRLLEKEIIERNYPKYTITSLVSRKEMQKREAKYMLTSMFDGSRISMFSAFFDDKELSDEEINELREMIDNSLKERV